MQEPFLLSFRSSVSLKGFDEKPRQGPSRNPSIAWISLVYVVIDFFKG